MPNQVAVFDPLVNPSGSFNTQLPNGIGTIHIINDSHVTLNFSINNFASMVTVVPAGATVNIPMCPPYVTIYWVTATKLITNVKIISSRIVVMAYAINEKVPDEKTTSRQVNPTNVGFIISLALSAGAAADYVQLIIFNPANSGVNGTLISAEASMLTGGNFANLEIFTSDPGISAAFQARNQNLGGPVSTIGYEFSTTTISPSGTVIKQVTLQSNLIFEFLPYPRQYIIPPGNGIGLASLPNSTTNTTTHSLEWTETAV